MADRDRDYDRDRDRSDRHGDAWRERDERWRSRERERPFSERASDEMRSWFGDDEARRRRDMDELRDERGERDRGEHWSSGADLNRERDFGRSEGYRGTSGSQAGRARPYGDWDRIGEASPFDSRSQEWASGPYAGRGPRNYQRSDERIREEICERLTRHGRIDASDIDIHVVNGEVTLEGSVDDRGSKRLAEDVAESVFGVRDVNNQLKVHRGEMRAVGTAGRAPLAGTANTPELTPPERKER